MTEPTIAEEAAALMAENGDDPTDQWARYWAIDKAMGRRGLLKTSDKVVAEPEMKDEQRN